MRSISEISFVGSTSVSNKYERKNFLKHQCEKYDSTLEMHDIKSRHNSKKIVKFHCNNLLSCEYYATMKSIINDKYVAMSFHRINYILLLVLCSYDVNIHTIIQLTH